MDRRMMRIAVAAPLFALAGLLALHSWNPLGNGYFAPNKDTPDGMYFTMAVVGLSIAAVVAAIGVVVVWPRSRKYGFLVVALLAGAASVVPALTFKSNSYPHTWPWLFVTDHGYLGWLRFDSPPQHWYWIAPHWMGVAIQLALAVILVGALAAHVLLHRRPRPFTRLHGNDGLALREDGT